MKKICKILLPALLLAAVVGIAGCYSCQTWNHMWGKGDVVAGAEHKFFLSKECRLAEQPKPVQKEKAPAPVKSDCGVSASAGHYPCDGCPVIRLEKNMPAEAAMNAEFKYTIKVINPTEHLVSNIVVVENIADSFKVSATSPKAQESEGKLIFDIGDLEGGQSRLLTISGMATSEDCLQNCASVSYIIPTCAAVKIVKPALHLQKIAPASVLLCENIPVKFIITNTGSGSVSDVKIEDALPAGLRTIEGKNIITVDAGALAAGQAKEFFASLKADKPGKYENKAMAVSSGGLKSEASAITEVLQPVLAITKTGPENSYLGREVKYDIKVSNKGNAPAANTVITDTIPAGVAAIKLSDNGKITGTTAEWAIGSLAVGASKTVSVAYTPSSAAVVSDTAKATAACADAVSASAKTDVKGIPAVLLEVIDIEDPIEVGKTETYVITATNQGSSPDTNIKIVCTLEDSMEYVSSSGATVGSGEGKTVTFAPLAYLAPKAKATWQVTVKALKPGDVRFTVVMTTDELSRPVQENEATRFYQ